jgi:GNAT superfamily N-acetyltransferase
MDEPLMYAGSIRKLWVGEAELYRGHLLRLDSESRRNRFGGAVSDDFIRRYCEPSALSGAIVYGFFVDGVLRGAAELRLLESAGDAEVALSIERAWQSQGVGTALLEHLLLVADSADLALAMLDVPSQLAKRLEPMNGRSEHRQRDPRCDRLMLVDNWR